jgi:hypothetical protein
MRVLVTPTFTPIRPGIEARSPLLELSGHGRDRASATESLLKSIRAWCAGLVARGELEVALRQRGVKWDPEGDQLVVEILEREGEAGIESAI